MKTKMKYLSLVAFCTVVLFNSCKNETKTTSSTETSGMTATQTTTDAKAIADSIAKVEAEALARAKEDSIAQAAAAAEMAAKEKNVKATTKPTTKTKTPTTTTTALPSKKPAPATTPATTNSNVKKRTGKDDVFVISEVKPSYPGGDASMMKFLKNNIKYPVKAKEEGIKGTVYVRFVVEKDGSVTDVEVAKGVNPLLDAEAKRVVSAMPKWTAGKQNGTNVAVQYTLPVKFELIE